MSEELENLDFAKKKRGRPPKVRTVEELANILRLKEEKEKRKLEREERRKQRDLNGLGKENIEEKFEPTDWDAIAFEDFAEFTTWEFLLQLKNLKENSKGQYIDVAWKKFYNWDAQKNNPHVFRLAWASVFLWDKIPWLLLWKGVSYRYTKDWNMRTLQSHDAQLTANWVQVLKKFRESKNIGEDPLYKFRIY